MGSNAFCPVHETGKNTICKHVAAYLYTGIYLAATTHKIVGAAPSRCATFKGP